MKHYILIILFLSIIMPTVFSTEVLDCENEGCVVTIRNVEFEPSSLTVKKGTTIFFHNAENATVHKLITMFNSYLRGPRLKPSDKFSYTFNDVGEFIIISQTYPENKFRINVIEINYTQNSLLKNKSDDVNNETLKKNITTTIPVTKEESPKKQIESPNIQTTINKDIPPENSGVSNKKKGRSGFSSFLWMVFWIYIIYFIYKKWKPPIKRKHPLKKKDNEILLEKKKISESTKEIEDLKKKNKELMEEKIKQEILLEKKKERKKELRKKYELAIEEAKGDYSGESLENEKESIKEDYKKEISKVDEFISNVFNKEESLSKKIETNKEKLQKIVVLSDSLEKGTKKLSTKSYMEFLDNFESKSEKCGTWADHVKIYIKLFNKNSEFLKHLARFIQEKYKLDNYDFIYQELRNIYDRETKLSKPDLITDLKEIDDMSGLDFEEYLRKLFECLGHSVTKTKASRDGGVDLILNKEGKTTLIQAKRYKITSMVGVSAVRDIYSKKDKYKANNLIVLTTSMKFSLDARTESKELGVELWNRDKFKDILRKSKLIKNG